MRRSRAFGTVTFGTTVILASLFAAAPAHAATLPDGQAITIVDVVDGTVWEASPADASVSLVGESGLQVEAIDVDDTGHGFAIVNLYNDDDLGPIGSVLYRADANTGTLSDPLNIVIAPDVLATFCSAIDLGPGGIVIAACFTSDGEDGMLTYIGAIDTETGVFSVLIEPDDIPHYVLAIAYDDATDTLYGFTGGQATPLALVLDTLAGTATEVTEMTHPALGADFDASGQLWITTADETAPDFFELALATLVPETGVATVVGVYPYPEVDRTSAVTVWGVVSEIPDPVDPDPTLPATGPADSSTVMFGIGALLVLGGVAVAVARNRRVISE